MQAHTQSISPHEIMCYETDFYGWTQQQVEFLRSGQLDHLDLKNLIEEIEDLGRQEKRELRHRLGILLGHLLKWHYQSDRRSRSWRATIREKRRRILEHLDENPSLKPYLPEAIAQAYPDALDLVERETLLNIHQLPKSCSFSQGQILDEPLE